MKKFVSSAVAAFLMVAGSVTFGVSAANATESYPVCTPSDAWTEVTPDIEHPAVTHDVEHDAVYGEPPLITPAVEYQPAVYETEYEFVHKITGKTRWETNPNWNAEDNSHSKGWFATGNTRDGALISPEVPVQDAVYGDAPLISEAWTETVIDTPAWTEDVPDIEHPAVTCPPVVPEQPATTVKVTTDEQKDCDAGMVVITTTTTTSGRTEYNEYTNTWVPIDDLVEITHDKREATETECPVVVTPPEEENPPVVTPPTEQPTTPVTPEAPKTESTVTLTSADVVPTGNTQALAETGSDLNNISWFGAALIAILGIGLVIWARFRPTHHSK